MDTKKKEAVKEILGSLVLSPFYCELSREDRQGVINSHMPEKENGDDHVPTTTEGAQT
jgi:hypothetical protein